MYMYIWGVEGALYIVNIVWLMGSHSLNLGWGGVGIGFWRSMEKWIRVLVMRFTTVL